MADVFLSYSRRDAEFVRRLATAIEVHGKQVWLDTDGIDDAEVFPQAIRTAIEQSDAFVFVITPAAIASSFCENEIEHARRMNKRIVPVLRDPVDDSQLPAEIRDRNWIPFTKRDAFTPSLERLLRALDRDLDHAKRHTRCLVKAIEWDTEGRDRSYLQRGGELKSAEAWLAGSPDGVDPAPTSLQRDYLRASRLASARRQQALVAGSLVVALISLGLLVFALISREHAVAAETIATSHALAAESENQQGVDPELSILLGMQAVRVSPTSDAMFALRAAIDASPQLKTLLRPSQVGCETNGPTIAYDPVAPLVAVGVCSGEPGPNAPPGRVLVFDRRDGHVVFRIAAGRAFAPTVAYSPDGSLLAVGTTDGEVELLDAHSERMLSVLGGATPPAGVIDGKVAFSPDGARLAVVTQTQARVWSLRRRVALTLEGPASPVARANAPELWSAGFTRDGQAVVVVGENGARVYAAATGALLTVLPGTRMADAMSLSRSDRELAVAAAPHAERGHNGVISIWNTQTWRRTATLNFSGRATTSVAFSPDGKGLAIGFDDGSAGLWSVKTDRKVANYAGSNAIIVAAAFAPAGNQVATASSDGAIDVWRAGGPELASFTTGPSDGIFLLRLTRNRLVAGISAHRVRTWLMPARPQRPVTIRVPGIGDGGGTLSSDGTLAAWPFAKHPGGLSAGVSINNTTTGRSLRTVATVPFPTGVGFSPDGRYLAVLGIRGVTPAALRRGPAARRLRAQEQRERPAAVDALTGAGIVALQWPHGYTYGAGACGWSAVAISRSDRLVAGAEFCGTITVWDAKTGRLLARFTSPGDISKIAFSPDGRDLAAGSLNSAITIWDVQKHTVARVLRGDTSAIYDLAYSPDGNLLATASRDHTARIWNPHNGLLLRVWRDPQPLTNIAFSSDGRQIVTGDATGTIRIWDACTACTNATRLLGIARGRVTRQLTLIERETYLGGR